MDPPARATRSRSAAANGLGLGKAPKASALPVPKARARTVSGRKSAVKAKSAANVVVIEEEEEDQQHQPVQSEPPYLKAAEDTLMLPSPTPFGRLVSEDAPFSFNSDSTFLSTPAAFPLPASRTSRKRRTPSVSPAPFEGDVDVDAGDATPTPTPAAPRQSPRKRSRGPSSARSERARSPSATPPAVPRLPSSTSSSTTTTTMTTHTTLISATSLAPARSPTPNRRSASPSKATSSSSQLQPQPDNLLLHPEADYLPSLPTGTPSTVRRTRRSTTPRLAVPYEPPTERFTSPEIVLLKSPPPPESSRARRSQSPRKKGTTPKPRSGTGTSGSSSTTRVSLPPQIKTEPPEVDLSRLTAPPSGSGSGDDDPLLLRGSEPPADRSRSMSRARSPRHKSTTPTPRAVGPPAFQAQDQDQHQDQDSSYDDREAGGGLATSDLSTTGIVHVFPESSFSSSTSSMPDMPSTPATHSMSAAPFAFPTYPAYPPPGVDPAYSGEQQQQPGPYQYQQHQHQQRQVIPLDPDASWTDSDLDPASPINGVRPRTASGGEKEGESEITGRWRQLRVPTKPDPPDEETAKRMQEWGRPVSPFPGGKRRKSVGMGAALRHDSGADMETGMETEEERGVEGLGEGEGGMERERQASGPFDFVGSSTSHLASRATTPPKSQDDEHEDPGHSPTAPVIAPQSPEVDFSMYLRDPDDVEMPDHSHRTAGPPGYGAGFQSFQAIGTLPTPKVSQQLVEPMTPMRGTDDHVLDEGVSMDSVPVADYSFAQSEQSSEPEHEHEHEPPHQQQHQHQDEPDYEETSFSSINTASSGTGDTSKDSIPDEDMDTAVYRRYSMLVRSEDKAQNEDEDGDVDDLAQDVSGETQAEGEVHAELDQDQDQEHEPEDADVSGVSAMPEVDQDQDQSQGDMSMPLVPEVSITQPSSDGPSFLQQHPEGELEDTDADQHDEGHEDEDDEQDIVRSLSMEPDSDDEEAHERRRGWKPQASPLARSRSETWDDRSFEEDEHDEHGQGHGHERNMQEEHEEYEQELPPIEEEDELDEDEYEPAQRHQQEEEDRSHDQYQDQNQNQEYHEENSQEEEEMPFAGPSRIRLEREEIDAEQAELGQEVEDVMDVSMALEEEDDDARTEAQDERQFFDDGDQEHDQDLELELHEDEDDEEDDENGDPNAVKLTSADPMAAARAAAILKLYNYDCTPTILQRRRGLTRAQSSTNTEALIKKSRKPVSGGINKFRTPMRRTFTSTSHLDFNVPGSPALSLPDLLNQAEEELREASAAGSVVAGSIGRSVGGSVAGSRRTESVIGSPEPESALVKGWRAGLASLGSPMPGQGWDTTVSLASIIPAWAAGGALLTPRRQPSGLGLDTPSQAPLQQRERSPAKTSQASSNSEFAGPRAWEKQDWKLLDTCFTDCRMAAGARMGLDANTMAGVDEITLDEVADRFCELVDITELGWNRDMLLRRAGALQNKQRAGHVAPPTPSIAFGRLTLGDAPTTPSFMDVHTTMDRAPEWTPAPSPAPTAGPSRWNQWSSPARMHPVTPAVNERDRRPFPVSLRAPRYSHLMEEAVAISRDKTPPSPEPDAEQSHSHETQDQEMLSEDEAEEEDAQVADESAVIVSPPRQVGPTSKNTLGSRVKGFFWSYLPTTKLERAQSKPKKPRAPAPPGVPLPPPEAYARPRPDTYTPARPDPERAPHPKELVHLNSMPPPLPPVPIKRDPRRLVDLRPISPPRTPPAPIDIPRRRRDSGSSVKDLVNSFEAMEDYHVLVAEESAKKVSLRKMKSRETLHRRTSYGSSVASGSASASGSGLRSMTSAEDLSLGEEGSRDSYR